MNIKLTHFEASELIREHFHSKGMHPNVEINTLEIEPVPTTPLPANLRVAVNLMELVEIATQAFTCGSATPSGSSKRFGGILERIQNLALPLRPMGFVSIPQGNSLYCGRRD